MIAIVAMAPLIYDVFLARKLMTGRTLTLIIGAYLGIFVYPQAV